MFYFDKYPGEQLNLTTTEFNKPAFINLTPRAKALCFLEIT